jgi:prefoldin alpha subunit
MENIPEKNETQYSLEELQYTLQAYQERYNIISDQIKGMLETIESFSAAQEALKNPNRLKGKNALLNIGGNLYVDTKINDPEKIVVGIGAGLIIEKSADGANEILNKRLERNSDVLNKLMQERKQIEGIIYDLSYKINETVG